MPKGYLGDTACKDRLAKYIEEHYSEEEQYYIAYYEDEITKKDYSFKYRLTDGALKKLTIDRASRKIVEKSEDE